MAKRLFASPLAKSYTPLAKGELPRKQGGQAFPVPQNHTASNGYAVKPLNAHFPKAVRKGQNKQKRSTKEDDCLTDSVFEEIVESVLKKSLEECMEVFQKIASSAVEQSLQKESMDTSPPTKEAVSGKPSKDDSEVMPLEEEHLDPQPEKRRYSKLSIKKDRNEENENPEADNGGRKEKRKGTPKKKVQGNAQIVHQEEKQKEKETDKISCNENREADNGGRKENRKGTPKKKVQGNAQIVQQEEKQKEKETDKRSCSWCVAWVQCSYPECKKWRRLRSDIDPSVLPENWSCSQNPDLQYNSCSIPEEMWSGSESEIAYAIYIPGSIVWAKQYGYPWWPGMVEIDPDIGEYFLFPSQIDSLPSKYHVTFFGDSVTRAWISASMLRNFGKPDAEESCLAKNKGKSGRKDWERAQRMANAAERISIPERIRMFGFCSRFNQKGRKDLDSLTCNPHAKKIQEPGSENESPVTSNKSQDQLRGRPAVGPDEKPKKFCVKRDKSISVAECSPPLLKRSRSKAAPCDTEHKVREYQSEQKGPKKSFVVPRCKNTKAKQPTSYTDSSSANLLLSSHPSEKENLNKDGTSPVAENYLELSKVTMRREELDKLRAFEDAEEEIFGSPEMTVFAEDNNYSPEDFSMVLFEE